VGGHEGTGDGEIALRSFMDRLSSLQKSLRGWFSVHKPIRAGTKPLSSIAVAATPGRPALSRSSTAMWAGLPNVSAYPASTRLGPCGPKRCEAT
jgi:hypothetical protein